MSTDPFNSLRKLNGPFGEVNYHALETLEKHSALKLSRLPYSLRILLESLLRNCDENRVTRRDVLNLFEWQPRASGRPAIAFYPGRILLQDFSGVPVLNDLAAMRAALQRQGGDPASLQPVLPVDLVVDHSIQVDFSGTAQALDQNTALEYERNRERYGFLRWCQQAFDNLNIVPPASGIIHQINLEHLARVVLTRSENGKTVAYPDSVLGTDSHTTMINGLGVAGWGIGGIEAVTAMLGEPVDIVIPDVIGVRVSGELAAGVMPTDLTLRLVNLLRKKGVVDKIVEFFGPGLKTLSLADRAMIANMSPESGATMTFFPVDEQTLNYLHLSGRAPEQIALVEAYTRSQHLFYQTDSDPEVAFSDVLEFDLGTVRPGIAGPRRPQDFIPLEQVKTAFRQALPEPKTSGGFSIDPGHLADTALLSSAGQNRTIGHGSIVLAAITSCTNTSNPHAMLAAGLLAQKAVALGLHVPPFIKTSLAPGSRLVTDMLQAAGLLPALEALGFNLVAYGCTTCIGNSGPLPEHVTRAIHEKGLVAAAVLSGNRNFEGRVSPHTQANYLASPALVVAYALAGRMDIDLTSEPLGAAADGSPVYLNDIWPGQAELQAALNQIGLREMFRQRYSSSALQSPKWETLPRGEGLLYHWQPDSTYLQEPPFFASSPQGSRSDGIRKARALALFGDSITTDHISPAGEIPVNSQAGEFLAARGIAPADFNAYGARRGNHHVMVRGTFANIRLKNLLVPGVEGGRTLHWPEGSPMSFYEAAGLYSQENTPLIILAGKEYGSGSSRDWAAKGPYMMGVRAVIAESFERIHRSNLAGMGILPLQFQDGTGAAGLQLDGSETFTIPPLPSGLLPRQTLNITAVKADGRTISFPVTVRLDTAAEIQSYHQGGIMNALLYNRLKFSPSKGGS